MMLAGFERAGVARATIALGGLVLLAACGGGGTTGTNYSDAPPVAEIVATPTPTPSETPAPTSGETPTPKADPADSDEAANAL